MNEPGGITTQQEAVDAAAILLTQAQELVKLRQLEKESGQPNPVYESKKQDFLANAPKIALQIALSDIIDGNTITEGRLVAIHLMKQALVFDKDCELVLGTLAAIQTLRSTFDIAVQDYAAYFLHPKVRMAKDSANHMGNIPVVRDKMTLHEMYETFSRVGYWSRLSKKKVWPGKRFGSQSVTVKKNVYFFSGLDFGDLTRGEHPDLAISAYEDMWCFDTTSKSWNQIVPSPGSSFPPGRGNGVMVHYEGYLYLFGGYASRNKSLESFGDVWVTPLPVERNGKWVVTWKKLCKPGKSYLFKDSARHAFGSAVFDGWLYVVNGEQYDGGRCSNEDEFIRIKLDPNMTPAKCERMLAKGNIPSSRTNPTTWLQDGKWFLTGGEGEEVRTLKVPEVYVFNFETATWVKEVLPVEPTPKYGLVPFLRTEMATGAATEEVVEQGSVSIRRAFFGGWCSMMYQSWPCSGGQIKRLQGTYYNNFLFHETKPGVKKGRNCFKAIVPDFASSINNPPPLALSNCTIVDGAMYIFFGYSIFDGETMLLPEGLGTGMPTRSTDKVFVCHLATEGLMEKNTEEANMKKQEMFGSKGYALMHTTDTYMLTRAMEYKISTTPSLRLEMSERWMRDLKANDGKKGIWIFVHGPGYLTSFPPPSKYLKTFEFMDMQEFLGKWGKFIPEDEKKEHCTLNELKQMVYVPILYDGHDARFIWQRKTLTPGYGTVSGFQILYNPVLAQSTPAEIERYKQIIDEDSLCMSLATRVRMCMGGNGCQGIEGNGVQLKTCAGCKQAWYCSGECQKRHWKEEHKAECGK
ncbi:hypothetical protein HDU79_008823 [Rhizoclosmatium sp. JEL0117]|nr:hypothetical protein HDU79_008823 [Rhizoclosmatium sp. JEL0117]